MNDSTETPRWGSFALVSYIPNPLGSFLQALRGKLPGEDSPQPHITLLPPRPLMLPVDETSQVAMKILFDFPAFEVELSKVSCFPETNVLYLDIGAGSELVRDLHSALNSDALSCAEQFAFRPHLTLSGPVPAPEVRRVRAQAESAWQLTRCPRAFVLDEIVFLWLSPDGPEGAWRRLWRYRLSANASTHVRAATAAITTQTY